MGGKGRLQHAADGDHAVCVPEKAEVHIEPCEVIIALMVMLVELYAGAAAGKRVALHH